MRARYLILLKKGPVPSASDLAAELGLTIAVDRPDLLVLTGGDCRSYALGEGYVLGTLFARFGPPAPVEATQLAIGTTDGATSAEDRLLQRYWGGYVGIVPARAGHRILRDPSGALPCYYAETGFGLVVASDMDLLLAVRKTPPAVGWTLLVKHLYLRGLPSPETCLHGIEELLPGYALDVSAGIVDQRIWWSPWMHVEADPEAGAPQPDQLRRVISSSVEALTAAHGRLLVSVSGGLDSSIVAACLARSGREVHCVTMYTTDPSGDERIYARELCRHLALPLTECVYRIDDVDLDQAMSPHLPRPIGRSLAQAYERAHLKIAQEIKADAFVTGNGGDNVLGFSQSAAAVTDHYLRHGLGLGLLRTIRDVCRQTESGPAEVVRAALRLKRRGYLWSTGPMFLGAEMLVALAPQPLHQPWLDVPGGVGPGKAAQVASLLRVQPSLEPGRSRYAPVLAPLLSQPVIETCLAIPSWEWRAGGRDRAVARAAFAADLPPAIIGRRSKGGPDGFSAIILREHRTAIRERLLDGLLARNGVVDRFALEARFADRRPFSGEEQGRLLELLDTEAWARTWSSWRSAVSRPGPPSDVPASSSA